MSRYIKEARFRFSGDIDACQTWIPWARTVLGEVYNRDILLGGVEQSWGTIRPDERTTISVYATIWDTPLVHISVQPIESEKDISGALVLYLQWRPEGLLLTPTTLENRIGWGLPSREPSTGARLEDPRGTKGGFLPQVLINRYENNNYHDNPRFLSGEIADGVALSDTVPPDFEPTRTRASYDIASKPELFGHRYAARYLQRVAYRETGVGGILDELDEDDTDSTVDYFFSDGLQTLGVYLNGQIALTQEDISEFEREDWYTHRPQELLYDSFFHEEIFRITTDFRLEAGEQPVARSLRGEANPAQITAELLSDPERNADAIFAHSYYGWDVALRCADERAHIATGQGPLSWFGNNTGENLQLSSFEITDTTVRLRAERVMDNWRNSPPHYENIINSEWTERELFPWSYLGGGMRGGITFIADGNSFSPKKVWVADSNPYSYALEDFGADNGDSAGPISVGGGLFVQQFQNRETWLPVPARRYETDAGFAETMAYPNVHGKYYSRNSRRIIYNNVVYDLPEGSAGLSFFTNNEAADPESTDLFLHIMGVVPFDRAEKRYLRVVTWHSTDRSFLRFWNLTEQEQLERGGKLIVYVAPVGIGPVSRLPWRQQEDPEKWEIEFEQEFTIADGWVPEPGDEAHFSSDGAQFVFELERATDFLDQGLDNRVVRELRETTISDPTAVIQRVPFIYDAPTEDTPAKITELDVNDPLEVTVQWQPRTGNVADDPNQRPEYVREVKGEYKVWPHFDANNQVQWVTLKIDERYQNIEAGSVFTLGDDPLNEYSYDTRNPRLSPDRHYCWRRRTMVFPSGKEIVYMQQYMINNVPVTFDPESPGPGFEILPGDGRNFFTTIQYLDVPNEVIMYAEHETRGYQTEAGFLDPFWDTIFEQSFRREDGFGPQTPAEAFGAPGSGRVYYRGDSTYYLDAGSGLQRIQETMVHYKNEDDQDWIQVNLTNFRWAGGSAHELRSPDDVYNANTAPYSFMAGIDYRNTRGEYVGTQINRIHMTVPGTRDSNAFPDDGGTTPDLRAATSFFPTTNYPLSFSGRTAETGDDRGQTYRRFVFGMDGERFYGQKSYGVHHNAYPIFSTPISANGQFAQYKDRWVARLEVFHIERGIRYAEGVGAKTISKYYPPTGCPPDSRGGCTGPFDGLNVPPVNEVTRYHIPHDAVDIDYFFSGREGSFLLESRWFGTGESWSDGGEQPQSAVHLKANFDLDEACGIEDVYDIAPFGRIG